ncbi:hypothetical protein Esti_005974 [Eimeria stiedai]
MEICSSRWICQCMHAVVDARHSSGIESDPYGVKPDEISLFLIDVFSFFTHIEQGHETRPQREPSAFRQSVRIGWTCRVVLAGSQSPTSTLEFTFGEASDDLKTAASGILTRLDEIERHWAGTGTRLTSTPSLSVATSPQVSIVEQEDTDESARHQALANPPRASSRPVTPGVVCVCVALLVSIGLLGLRAHRRVFPTRKSLSGLLGGTVAQPLDDDVENVRAQTAREGVGSLRALLPAEAAKAAVTEEAERRVTAARRRVWKGEKAATGDLIGLE